MKTTIQTTLLMILLLVVIRPAYSQIQTTYYVEVDEVRHRTYNWNDCVFNPYYVIYGYFGGGPNKEFETSAKLTAKAWVYDNENSSAQGGDCMKKTGSFDSFNSYGSGTFLGSRTGNATKVFLKLKAWEDDEGDRCDYEFGDDCYIYEDASNHPIDFYNSAPPSASYNLTHQGGDIFGDSDKKLYVNVRWHYTGNDGGLNLGCHLRTQTDQGGAIRVHSVYLESGTNYIFNTISGPDNFLTMYAPDGYTVVAQDNDGGSGNWAKISFTATSTGWHYLENSAPGRIALSTSSKFEYKIDETYSGGTEEYGNNYWQVYAYDYSSFPNTENGNQTGGYIDSYNGFQLNFDARNLVPVGSSPSDVSGWTGCKVGPDSYTLAYKRTNIPCDYYVLIATHDNQRIKIDGAWDPVDGTFDTGDTIYKGPIRSYYDISIECFISSGSGEFGVEFSTYTPDIGTLPPGIQITDNTHSCETTSVTGSFAPGGNPVRGWYGEWAWYKGSCGGTRISTNTTFTTNISETTVFYLALEDVFCNNLQTICLAETAYVDHFTQAVAGDDFLTCNQAGTLDANSPESGIGTWSVVSGSASIDNPNSPTSTVSNLADGQNVLRWTLDNGDDCPDSYDDITIQSGPPGDPSEYGDQEWRVYAYNTTAWSLPSSAYQGYYIHSGSQLSYDTRDEWDEMKSPDNASSWYGCNIPNNNFTYVYRRTNFDCDYYEIKVGVHDGGVRLKIDGTTIVTYSGQGGPHNTAWTGYLGSNSKVEFIQLAYGGSTYHEVTITPAVKPALQSGSFGINPADSVCDGDPFTLIASSTTATDEKFYWYKDGCGTTQVGSGIFASLNQNETTTYYLRVENYCRDVVSECDSITVHSIVNEDADAGPNQYLQDTCATTLNATAPAVGTGTWTLRSGSGNILDPHDPNTIVTDLESGNNKFEWRIDNGICWPSDDEVTIQISPQSNCAGGWFKTTPQPEAAVQEATLEAFPNPFHQSTTLRFSTPTGGLASLEIYNTNGQQVAALFQGEAEAGQPYELNFDPGDHSAGIYFAILRTADGAILNRKLIQLK
ncbi:MAG: T9SS type A sorting domain-containing protein [Bacteroidia bacterium]|nr:T9SS type A sorting domain-containing protein [Bacteroidia bacterium]